MRSLLVALGLAAITVAAHAGETTARGVLAIDTDGSVTSVRFVPGLPEVVERALERSVSGWRFEPPVVDGSPAAVSTGLSLRVTAQEHGDDLVLELGDAQFGAVPVHAVPPRYPHSALNRGAGAEVAVRLLVGDDGDVVDTHVHRTTLTHGRLSNIEVLTLRGQLERAVTTAIAQWRFDPQLVPPGSTVPYVVELTVDTGRSARGRRTAEFDDGAAAPWQDGDPHMGLVALSGIRRLDDASGTSP